MTRKCSEPFCDSDVKALIFNQISAIEMCATSVYLDTPTTGLVSRSMKCMLPGVHQILRHIKS